MADMMMLLVALVAFAALTAGWMILPVAPVAEQAPDVTMPAPAAKAA